MHRTLTVLLALSLCAAPALAHGGRYLGPSDASGGSDGSGGGSAPPTNPAGAAAPGPGGPGSGRPTTRGESGGGITRGSGGRRQGAVTGGGQDFAASHDTWEFWWEANKDAYLDLKGRLGLTGAVTGSSSQLTGRGSRTLPSSSRRPSLDLIADLLPTLGGVLRASDERDVLDSAVLAMARMAYEADADAVISAATPLLAHDELSVRTSATLALGVLGSPKAAPTLRALVADTTQGRHLAGGRGEVDWLVRAFAALALGLVDEPGSAATLVDVIDNSPDSDRDVKVCAIVALGLMDDARSPQVTAYLTGLLADRKLDAVIKSYVPTTLARLGAHGGAHGGAPDPTVLPALLAAFTDRDTDHLVRQSIAIALGLLADAGQPEATGALFDVLAEGRDAQTRHFALISLAKIGARDGAQGTSGASGPRAAFHERLTALLEREMTRPEHSGHKPWAALAAALYARDLATPSPGLAQRLKDGYASERTPSTKSAFALAIGLMGLTSEAPALLADFVESSDQDNKGYKAVALGFLRHTAAADVLNAQCRLKSIAPTYRLQVATGLGLMGDPEATATLTATLQDAQTLGVSSAVARALGLIGDRDAVEPLVSLATDGDAQPLTRAFACVALGLVCEKTSLPWNARIAADNNYRAAVPAISEVIDIL